MEYTNVGRSGVKVSRLCLGAMMFGGATSREDSIHIIDRALDDGINFIDTANGYNGGASEEIVGKALEGKRHKTVLVTKVAANMGDWPNGGGLSRAHIMSEVDNSLRRLKTDYIDIYMLHRPDYSTPLNETIEAMGDLVKRGKVRYVGMSNHYAWQMCSALWIADQRNLAPVMCGQQLYNIVNRDIELEQLPFCQEHGVGMMVYSPLARGVLTGKYQLNQELPEGSRAARGDSRIIETELRDESLNVAMKLNPLAERHGKPMSQFALNWILANPIITSVIVGPRTMEQFVDNLGCLGWDIDDEALKDIDRLVPPGEHTGWGFNDPITPVLGRPS
jgi:aryl-alcohol dehydrogenase-like predicted oxidoreductase